MIWIIVIGIILIVGFEASSAYFNKKGTNVNVDKFIESKISEIGLHTKLVLIDKGKAQFDIDENSMCVTRGNNLQSLSEGIHELGHAIDFRAGFNVFIQNVLYFTKPVIIFSFITCFIHQLSFNRIVWTISIIVSAISLILMSLTLKDELMANKHAFNVINCSFDKKTSRKIKICLISALSSYFIVWVVTICILVTSISVPKFPIF